jgi:ABC-2 type transport system permease protein
VIRAVLRKDLAVTLASPIPWIAGALFHLVLGLLFVSELVARRLALIQPMFPLAGFLLLILVPIVTMRSLAEEARTGTLDLLQAIPVSTAKLVVGKWLAAWATTLLIIATAGAAVVVVSVFGDPDPGPATTGFLGLAMMSAALTGIGVFASSMTKAQPVAAVFGFFIGLILWFAHIGSNVLVTGAVLAHLSISERLRSFAAGVIDTGDIAFLLILTAGSLVLAATAVDARRLR